MILEQLVASVRKELAVSKKQTSLAKIMGMAERMAPPLNFAAALTGDGVRLIAEVKKASPSAGTIRPDFDPVAIARTYASNGASAISVLTETKHFLGGLNHLKEIRKALPHKPLLRKDFIFDLYQVYEARVYGADCILLIVAILSEEQLSEMAGLSQELGMSCLVEVHNETELQSALRSGVKIIGINNRDLKTFAVDITTTERLRPLIPPGKIVVSESGIKSREDMVKMKQWGVNAVLVGEALLAAPDIATKMRELRDPG